MPVLIPGSNADYLSFPDGTGAVALNRLPKKTQRVSIIANVLHFDGIAYPRVYYGENQDDTWDVSFRMVPSMDTDQWAALRALLESRAVLLWRDTLGNAIYCAVTDISQDPQLVESPTYFTDLKFTLTRVTYP